MKKSSLYLFLFFMTVFSLVPSWLLCQTSDSDKQISLAISSGNATELAGYFNTMVDLNIPGAEDSYGKPQATRILQDFFTKYPVKSYKTTKQGSSNDGSMFSIGKMESGNSVFRIYYLMKKSSGRYLIHQFQIQEEN
jgi:hypothetical protein